MGWKGSKLPSGSIAFSGPLWNARFHTLMGTPPERLRSEHTLATAALVLAACYLGASADVWLRFPGLGTAILFPPYAIVTAALWRTRPRSWWLFLLAASAGDFLPHRFGGASVAFVLMTEGVNHARALMAAVGLRRFAGRVETLREMVAYLVIAVIVAPCLAALAGASVVTWLGHSSAFWLAWHEWWLSNALTGLTLLPLFTLDVRPRGARLRVPFLRFVEGALLALALFGIGVSVFANSYGRFGIDLAHRYWAMPLLTWAAVRFGPRGTAATLLGIASLSIWGAISGRMSFAAGSPADNLLELQVFLLAVSVPSLLLAVLIQQQHRTAAALMESRRQYRSVVEDQTEMICRFRPDGSYTFANRAYAEAFAIAPHDLVGASIWSSAPPGVHRTRSELDAITSASPIATREVSVATREGATRWQQWRDRGFFDERGVVEEYQSVGRDVTDRRRAEDERRALEAQKSVEAALREAERRKDEFLATLGHELRNPLAPIGASLEILRRAPPGSGETVWARESIGRQLRHMTRLIDDLLDISRITLGKIQLQLESVDLGTVIANAEEATRPLIDASGHELTVRRPDDPVRIRGDALRLTQVVANLLSNAAKYTERGGRIEVTLEREVGSVRLSVRDNGIGLAPEALETIFELYSQVPADRVRAQGGLGIGLALVRRLVELHGGTVVARSEGAGTGSEMIVRLPAVVHGGPERERPGAPADPVLEDRMRAGSHSLPR